MSAPPVPVPTWTDGGRVGALSLPPVDVVLEWHVSRLAWRLALVGVLAVALGVITARPEPVVLAAPCLVAVVVALRQPRPASVTVSAEVSESRTFEDEPVQVTVRLRAPQRLGTITLHLDLPGPQTPVRSEDPRQASATTRGGPSPAQDGSSTADDSSDATPTTATDGDVAPPGRPGSFDVPDGRVRQAFAVAELVARWTVRAQRWGRWRLGPLRIRVRTPGWGYVGVANLRLSELTVFPPPARARDITIPPMLLARLGTHVGRRAGSGSEFIGIRTFAVGDAVRRINWPVSTRRITSGELYVNEYAAERAADVVAVVDTTTDVGPAGWSSLDIGVRGAASVVQAYLRYADRVGIVALGGRVRWLKPDVGTRQYYRVVETLLASRLDGSFVEPDLFRLPRQALPPGALVFVFSPLLDPRVIDVIRDLRERGHPVVVVDVLTTEPPVRGRRVGPWTEEQRHMALRIWRLDREVLVRELEVIGATVVVWDETAGVPLERVRLQPLLRGGR
ncbi:DUF58 domain-containing protein [Thermasporomyces composti]|uniref:Uncharacterized protein (DUF58 family) n=1 Tax=Thermasporomyces composti TaxID=696763 RepID=A0A3D9V961_THECX|nr:DUF58 domain-containing protein [Thermasporomyces composti]REF36700.1 uncharacterized protein (DUF58 family) [Thermasporomyces composti]